MVRIHNRPAYNSECHATREMGVGELNNSYEDAELADTIMAIGTNAYETQTNYFLAHWLPNLQGGTVDKKKQALPRRGRSVRARIIFVDPRRTTTISVAEAVSGRTSCTSTSSRAPTSRCSTRCSPTSSSKAGSTATSSRKYTNGFDAAVAANKLSLEEAAQITGVPVAKLRKAAEWAYKPKAGGPASAHDARLRERASSGATTTT